MAISLCVNWSGAVLHELSSLSPLPRDESPPTAIKRWSFSHSFLQPITESTVNLQQRQNRVCVCNTFRFWVCSHTQMTVAITDLSPCRKNKSQGEKTKWIWIFHVEELPIKQNFKENRGKPKANFIYLLQRHRGRSDIVKAVYGAWSVCAPFWESCISLCRYSS